MIGKTFSIFMHTQSDCHHSRGETNSREKKYKINYIGIYKEKNINFYQSKLSLNIYFPFDCLNGSSSRNSVSSKYTTQR